MRALHFRSIFVDPGQKRIFLLLLGIGYLIIAFVFLRKYLLWNPQWLLGLALLPLVAMPVQKKISPVLLVCLGLTLGLAAFSQVVTIFFLGYLLALWCTGQHLLGRSGFYALLMLLVASPIFQYVADVWSFPLRLQLTQAAASILSSYGASAEAAGNTLLLNGEEFSVDPACDGLSMLSFSYMMGVYLLAYLHRTTQKPWPYWLAGALLLVLLGLNLGGNLTRILVLVLLRIGPEEMMHGAVGLVCLVLYTLLPFFLLARFINRKMLVQTDVAPDEKEQEISPNKLLWHGALLCCLAGIGVMVQNQSNAISTPAKEEIMGFKLEVLPTGVFQYTNQQALIYMKPIKAFYSTEHHPLICWEGSGYLFRQVAQREVAGQQVFTGILTKGKDRLYTAWWMDNGFHQTITQTDWRWRMAKREPSFKLVNVTTNSEAELITQVKQLLKKSGPQNAMLPRRSHD
ncbi:exosortase N [Rufibacter aurantiacus]|uniref:exosortase N n=1 Tax=Rufibacter aurantiacus TaxID=2817374 RepID=UPI001B311C41|nr:exosortase N [Rufibacter aurantiacus]